MSFLDRPSAVRAFSLAVLVPAALTALGAALIFLFESSASESGYAGLVLLVGFLVAAVVIFLAAVLIGLPLTAFLAGRRAEAPWIYQVAGALVGGLIMLIGLRLLGTNGPGPDEGRVMLLAFGVAPGFLSGEIWWRFNRKHAQPPAGR